MKKTGKVFVGTDVSKAWLDVAVHEQKEVWRVSNEEVGIQDLVKKLKQLKPKLIVLEPTGGFEMLVVAEPGGLAGGGGECQASARLCKIHRADCQDG